MEGHRSTDARSRATPLSERRGAVERVCRGAVLQCGGVPCYLGVFYEEAARKSGGAEAGRPGVGDRGAGSGLSLGPRGGGGSPRRLGAKPRPVCPSLKFLRFGPRNLPTAGNCGPRGTGGVEDEEEAGGHGGPGGRHRPWTWGRPLPGATPSSSCVFRQGGAPPMGACARCRGHKSPLGAGMKRPVTSPPNHTGPPGAAMPLAPAGVGKGGWGSAAPIRTPGSPHCLDTASEDGAGLNRTCGPHRPCRGVRGGGGSRGGHGTPGSPTLHWRR